MSEKLLNETIKRVSEPNKVILRKYAQKYLLMDTNAKEALMTLCFIMLDELGDEEE